MRLVQSTLTLLAIFIPQAYCWGALGHRTIAYLAYKHLTPKTALWADAILANDRGFDFSDAAIWADAVRHAKPYSGPWHFIDAPDTPPIHCGLKYPDSEACALPAGCIISAILNQTSLLISPTTDPLVRQEALMYVIHFLGDIHQPLHAEGILRGGNDVPVCFGKEGDAAAASAAGATTTADVCPVGGKTNLHSVWDTSIPRKIVGLVQSHPTSGEEKVAAALWANKLFNAKTSLPSPDEIVPQAECTDISTPDVCSLAWARESNSWICAYVMKNGLPWLETNDLSGEYYEGAVPIVEELISKAGLRLAAWLEGIVAAVKNEGKEQLTMGSLEL